MTNHYFTLSSYVYLGWPSKVKRIRFHLSRSFLLRDSHTRSIIISHFPFRVHFILSLSPSSPSTCQKLQLPTCVDLHSKRAARLRGGNTDVTVKGRNVAGIAQAFVVENRSTFYVPTSIYGRKEKLARSRVSSELSIPRKSTRPGQKGRRRERIDPQWIIDLIPNG